MPTDGNTNNEILMNDLLTIANANIEPGDPAMPADSIVMMLACVLADDPLFEGAVAAVRPLHFRSAEADLLALWQVIAGLHAGTGRRPTLTDIINAVSERLQEEQTLGATTPGLNQLLAAGGLLEQLGHHELDGQAASIGRPLIRQFLRERDVFEPLTVIHSSPAMGFGTDHRLPPDIDRVLHMASQRLDEIERDWGDPEPWPDPEPLDGPDLPTFPVDVLPPTLRQWVEAEATATQTPVDLAAMLALAVCAAAGAKGIEVEARPGFREPINIYTACALEPGNRKSVVFANVTEPLRDFEQFAAEELQPEVRAYDSKLSIWTARLKHLETSAAKAQDTDDRNARIDEAIAAREEITRLARVVEPKLLIDDCTVQKVEQILAEQGGRVAVMSPEGGVFALMTGRYSDSPNFEVYLKGHSGDDIRTDRIGRSSVFVMRPAITMVLTVQPEVIRGLGQTKALRGQGLLARILYVLPRSMLGRRQTNAPPLPPEISANYNHLVRRMCEVFQPGVPSSGLQLQMLALSPDAAARFEQFERELEPRLGRCGDLAEISDWAGKLAGAVVRLAGILHLIEQADRQLHPREQSPTRVGRQAASLFVPWRVPISGNTIAAAISIAEYLIPHAQAAFAMMALNDSVSAGVLANAFHVLDWIRAGRLRTFARRELHQAHRRRLHNSEDVDAVLELLARKNIIRLVPRPATNSRAGRPQSPRWEVNPQISANS